MGYTAVKKSDSLERMDHKKSLATPAEKPAATRTLADETAPTPSRMQRVGAYVPGVAVCLLGALVALAGSRLVPGMSALLIAIILGAIWRNVAPVPTTLAAGVTFSAKKILRLGIVLLGFQLSLSAILDLGFGVLLIVVIAVATTFFATLWIGQLIGISFAQRLLIASGFSICGAAAVAATEGTIKSKDEEVATAIALVVLFGTLMIPLVPFLGSLLGLPEETLGMWIGASTHEVAQVVAAGGAVGSGALAVAVTVKLARVLTLAPIMAGIAVFVRGQNAEVGAKKPPIIPVFVLGFIVTMLLRTAGFLPDNILSALEVLQTLLLAAAMFALGLGVHLPSLFRVGARPVVLGLISTTFILAVSLGGSLIFSA